MLPGSLALCLLLSACQTLQENLLGDAPSGPAPGSPGYVRGFIGGVAADEPRAVLIARDALSSGGTAADAAVAAAFALTVTLPSRAGLGGGGVCLAYDSGKRGEAQDPEVIAFTPAAPPHPGGGDRPAAIPLMARGLFALHARHGKLPFEQLMVPAEQLARFGVPASRALARDIAVVASPLAGDPNAAEVFVPGGQPLGEGGKLIQPALAATLSQLRTSGVGDLYQGLLSQTLADAATRAGGGLSAADLRAALPARLTPMIVAAGNDKVAFPPPAVEGGLATVAAFRALRANKAATDQATARALAVASAWRRGGADAAALLLAPDLPPSTLDVLPASTTLLTLDRQGNAVACAFTMNNLFGTGRLAPGTGVLLAASPARVSPPLLAVALAYNTNIRRFRAETGGSGQEGAPVAAALPLIDALADNGPVAHPLPATPPDPGRANVVQCNQYLPEEPESCGWATDPRGAGLALGSN